ncbi:kinesin light chain [Fusarium beomiforme]|uniref:Kinesin light chain n=1 Tax=Fusarium beomiforme TaxID=44412 RepID=A0A9P5ATA4_9HYPO|nr:kinesin light chain [Fusarium beomiforme]
MSTTKRKGPDRTVILDPEQYKVAWFAPLEIEAKVAISLLDEKHQGHFPVSPGDDYIFIPGAMGGHNIIVATLPAGQEYGTGSAAALASQLKKCFPNLWFGLLVGVAAGLPDLSQNRDIRLGDVLVGLPSGDSAGLIAYDLGKETENGFELLRHGHSQAVTEPIVRSAIGNIKFQALNESEAFLPYFEKIADLQHATGTFADPGQHKDILYDDNGQAIQRPRRPTHQRTRVWYGSIGSGDKLLKRAEVRNKLRDKYDIIGLEMEAAGITNRIPVGVIRGVCDYGDRHKNKNWQPYAAAMAASYARALLDVIRPPLPSASSSDPADKGPEPCYYLPMMQSRCFTGRQSVLQQLDTMAFGQEPIHRIALVGLGGVGKTQIALQFARQAKDKHPEYSIFWVPTLSDEGAQGAYVEIAKLLGLEQANDDVDIKNLVRQHLESNKAGKWLLIVDNADDADLILGWDENPGLEQYLPLSETGVILITTRTRKIAVDLAQSDVIDVHQMEEKEAKDLFRGLLIQKELVRDKGLVLELLKKLTFLPLAITQASAYLNQNKATIQTYLKLLQGAESEVSKVLGQEFRDNTRYKGSRHAIGTTWTVSFNQIQKSSPLAVELLSFTSYIEPKAIPLSLLPGASPVELESVIGTLCSYSFLARREEVNTFDMHSLVHAATREWLEEQERGQQSFYDALRHVAVKFPRRNDANYNERTQYIPHAMRLLSRSDQERTEYAYILLEKVGDSFCDDRRFKESIECFEEVCAWRQAFLPRTDPARLRSEHNLGSAYINDRRIDEAIEVLTHVVETQACVLGKDDLNRLASEHELGRAYVQAQENDKAIKMLEHVVHVKKGWKEEDPHRLDSEYELARAYLINGKIEDAIGILEHIVAVEKKTASENNVKCLLSRNTLGSAYLKSGRTDDAIRILERSRAICVETLRENDDLRLSVEHELGVAYIRCGRLQEGIRLFEHVVGIEDSVLFEKNPDHIASAQMLARAYVDGGRITDAINVLEHVAGIRKDIMAHEDMLCLASEPWFATAYQKDRQILEVIDLLERVLSIDGDISAEDDLKRRAAIRLLEGFYVKLEELRNNKGGHAMASLIVKGTLFQRLKKALRGRSGRRPDIKVKK